MGLAYMGELLSRNHCCRSKSQKTPVVQGVKKNGQKSHGIKSLEQTSLNYFGQIGASMCAEQLVKERHPPVSQLYALVDR